MLGEKEGEVGGLGLVLKCASYFAIAVVVRGWCKGKVFAEMVQLWWKMRK